MPTSKPKIAGYLDQSLFAQFKAFAATNNFSDSQAIAYILEEYFGKSPSDLPSELPGNQSRLDAIEREINLLKDMYAPIYNKLFSSESPSDSPGSILDDIAGTSDSPGELPSDLPSESLSDLPSSILDDIAGTSDSPGELPSDLPSESLGDLPSDSPEKIMPAEDLINLLKERRPHTKWEDIAKMLDGQGFRVHNPKSGKPNKPSRVILSAIAANYGIK